MFLILTAIEIKLFDISRSLPFVNSIFFFGLVNFNIILFLLLFFLIFRNVVKTFAERPGQLGRQEPEGETDRGLRHLQLRTDRPDVRGVRVLHQQQF